jgi:hypothetical protein
MRTISLHSDRPHTRPYECLVLSGATSTGKAGTSSKPPAIGTVITVVYDPDRPARSQVYPVSLVRPAS